MLAAGGGGAEWLEKAGRPVLVAGGPEGGVLEKEAFKEDVEAWGGKWLAMVVGSWATDATPYCWL